jgi:NAD(P)H-hydrate epimerase
VAVLPTADLVIDAAFGTGFRGAYAPPDPRGAPVLSVDIPSGVHGDTGAVEGSAVQATATVTMAALKLGLLLGQGPDRAGALRVADIGLAVGDPAAHLVEDEDVRAVPARPRTAHKWSRAVWVVAGSPGMRGAPSLCLRGAQRAGAGMVRAGSPGLDASDHPPGEAVFVGLTADAWASTVLGELGRFHAVVAGPGLGRSDETAAGVRELVAKAEVPTVLDADALFALGDNADDAAAVIKARAGDAPVVLTPHDGEFARLAGGPPGADRVNAARALADRTGAVLLLKGPTTIVASPGTSAVLLAAAGDARLATAGSGDVLAGVIGAFLAAGVPAALAAALAAHVCGRAAGLGLRTGLVAGDVPDLVARYLSGIA